jgi:hypothetical protein
MTVKVIEAPPVHEAVVNRLPGRGLAGFQRLGVGDQHRIDVVGDDHAGRRVVGELRVEPKPSISKNAFAPWRSFTGRFTKVFGVMRYRFLSIPSPANGFKPGRTAAPIPTRTGVGEADTAIELFRPQTVTGAPCCEPQQALNPISFLHLRLYISGWDRRYWCYYKATGRFRVVPTGGTSGTERMRGINLRSLGLASYHQSRLAPCVPPTTAAVTKRAGALANLPIRGKVVST